MVTDDVVKFPKMIFFKLVQLRNILFILYTFEASKSDKSTSMIFSKSSNIDSHNKICSLNIMVTLFKSFVKLQIFLQ